MAETSGQSFSTAHKRRFQHLNLGQVDEVNGRESVLAGARTCLNQDAFLKELADASLDCGLAQLSVSLYRALIHGPVAV